MKSHALKSCGALAVAVAAIGAGAFAVLNQSPSTAHRSGPSSYAELIALPEQELSNVVTIQDLRSVCGGGGHEWSARVGPLEGIENIAALFAAG